VALAVSDWLGLEGKGVVIAGGGGVGGAIARGFCEVGARVVVIDRDCAKLAALDAAHRLAGTVEADLRTAEACRGALDEAIEQLGRQDVFVHAVGTNRRMPIEDYSDDEWLEIVTLNLSSAFWLGQETARRMRAQGAGRMIFFSSVASVLAHAHHGPYAATKGGINQLVRVMANELAPTGITVNGVAPGYVETDLTSEYLAVPGNREAMLALIPAGRFGTADELIGPTLFLASHHAAFVTGHVLTIDGARSCV
jgi:gluconate 5-dehydrogenase